MGAGSLHTVAAVAVGNAETFHSERHIFIVDTQEIFLFFSHAQNLPFDARNLHCYEDSVDGTICL
jgi:hypothetical protein